LNAGIYREVGSWIASGSGVNCVSSAGGRAACRRRGEKSRKKRNRKRKKGIGWRKPGGGRFIPCRLRDSKEAEENKPYKQKRKEVG